MYSCGRKQFELVSTDGLETYPALRFEHENNMSGLGAYWKMPEGQSMQEMERFFWDTDLFNAYGLMHVEMSQDTILTSELAEQRPDIKAAFKDLYAYVDIFKSLNPELNDIQVAPDDWHQIYGFVRGVVSGFSVQDIDAWVSHALNRKMVDHLEERMIPLKGEMLCEGRGWVPWVPCPETVQKIHKDLDDKYGADIAPPTFG